RRDRPDPSDVRGQPDITIRPCCELAGRGDVWQNICDDVPTRVDFREIGRKTIEMIDKPEVSIRTDGDVALERQEISTWKSNFRDGTGRRIDLAELLCESAAKPQVAVRAGGDCVGFSGRGEGQFANGARMGIDPANLTRGRLGKPHTAV